VPSSPTNPINPVSGLGLTSLGSQQFSGMPIIEGFTYDQQQQDKGNADSPPLKFDAESHPTALMPGLSDLNSTLVPSWAVEADQL